MAGYQTTKASVLDLKRKSRSESNDIDKIMMNVSSQGSLVDPSHEETHYPA